MWWKALDMVLFTTYVLGVIPFLRGFTQGLADARRKREQERRRADEVRRFAEAKVRIDRMLAGKGKHEPPQPEPERMPARGELN